MTLIIGYIAKDELYMAGDSAAVSTGEVTIRKDSKVFFNGPFLIGCAGSFRAMQVIRFKFKPPKQKRGQDDYRYMCTDFIDSIRAEMITNGCCKMVDGLQEMEAEVLVGYNKRLYIIDNDFQVGENKQKWSAIGSGTPYALAACMSLDKHTAEADLVMVAMSIGAEYCDAVRPPFTLLSQKF